MDYQRQLQAEQRRALKEAMKINQQMENVNANLQKLNSVKSMNLGIPQVVFDFLQQMIQYNIRITRNNIIQFYNNNAQYFQNSIGQLTEEKIKLIAYTNKLMNGTQSIDDEKDIKKLFKTVSLNRYKITVNDLKVQRCKVYLTKFAKEEINNILKALSLFGIANPKNVLMKIAKKQKETPKEISYLVGNYSEWEVMKIANDFTEFRTQYNSNLEIIIQPDKNEIVDVPRYIIIKNIKEEPFTIYNSKDNKKFYPIESVSQVNGRVLLKTDLKPVIKYRGNRSTKGLSLDIPTETEISMGKYKKGEVKVHVDKGYYSLCNRFIITGTLRVPSQDTNLGYYKMIAKDGTSVYVCAKLIPYNKIVGNASIKEQRIYYIGFNKNEIQSKLTECAMNLQHKLGAYIIGKFNGDTEFTLFKQAEKLGYDD